MIRIIRVVGLLVLVLIALPTHFASASQNCPTPSSQLVATKIDSKVYAQSVPVILYLPPCYPMYGNYPVLYLLHGGNSDETQWPDLNIQSAADTLIAQGEVPFVIVIPGGLYVRPYDYTDFVLKDLIPSIEAQYPLKADRASRGIAGLSLGGYYALRIAMLNPDLFVGVGGYSPVVLFDGAKDPLPLAQRLSAKQLDNLQFDLDVGDLDSLRGDTQYVAQQLQTHGASVVFTMGKGGHFRDYWRQYSYQYFKFFADLFQNNTF